MQFTVAASDEITPLTVGRKISFPIETDFVLTNLRAFLSTPQATGPIFTVDVKQSEVSILSTKIMINNDSSSSLGAIQSVISNPLLSDYSPISLEVTQIGDGTAKGLKVTFYGYRPLGNTASPPVIPVEALIDRTSGTNIGNMTALSLENAFNGITDAAGMSCVAISSSPGYIGKTYSSGKKFSRAIVYGGNDRGFIDGANPSVTIKIYGKNGTPSNASDGTIIGSLTFIDTVNESAGRTITSTDTTNRYTSIWAYINGGAISTYCGELVLYELI